MSWIRELFSSALGVAAPNHTDEADSSHRLEMELAYAASRIGAGLRERDSYVVASGLDIFADLAQFAVNYQSGLKEREPDPRQSGGPGVYGDEWRILLGEISKIQGAATQSDDPRLRSDVFNFLLRIGTRLMTEGHYPASRDVTSSIGWLWDDIVARRGYWTAGDEDYFLMRIRETANYTVPSRQDSLTHRVHAEALCGNFARFVRLALANNAMGSAQAAVATLMEAREYADASEYQKAFERARDATLLALLGWVLLNVPSQEPEPYVGLAQEILSHLDKRNPWDALVHALDDDFQYAIGVTWWEMEGKAVRGVSGGFLEIDTYIRVAALLAGGRRGTMSAPASAEDVVGDLAWSLSETLRRLSEGAFPKLAELLPSERGREAIARELQLLVEGRDHRRGQELAEASLDPVLVAAFHAAVGEAARNTHSVLDLLKVRRPASDSPRFGFNRLEHKWWFVRAHVSAEPTRLAENFVRGLKRGEDEAVLGAIREAAKPSPLALDDFGTVLGGWIAEHQTLVAPVIITNSWMMAEALVGPRYDSLQDGAPLLSRIGDIEVPVYRVADAEAPFMAITSSPDGLDVSLGELTNAEDGGVLHDASVMSVVRQPTGEEIAALVSDTTPERELRQRTVVKVLQALSVEVADAGNVGLWLLPESTY